MFFTTNKTPHDAASISHPNKWNHSKFNDRQRKLPARCGVYALLKNRTIYYIGRSNNLADRWAGHSHHRYNQAEALGNPDLYWLEISTDCVNDVELDLIRHHKPLWNYTPVPENQEQPIDNTTGLNVAFYFLFSCVLLYIAAFHLWFLLPIGGLMFLFKFFKVE